MNQSTTHPKSSQSGVSPAPASAHSDLASELQVTRQQLKSVSQQNRQLIQQNQQLRVEIERIMASALNLHHIVYSEQSTLPSPESAGSRRSADGETTNRDDTPAAEPVQPAVAPEAALASSLSEPSVPKGVASDKSSASGTGTPSPSALDMSALDTSAPDASAPNTSAPDTNTDDMFAELDRLLATDSAPQPISHNDDESLRAALSHVTARRRADATPAARPKLPVSKPPTHLRQTIAAPTPAPAASTAPRRPNLWLILAVAAVMLSCFGAGFLLTLPLLQQSSDR